MSKECENNRCELEIILDRVCDQSATAADRQRLNELLAGASDGDGAALRRHYVDLMRLQAALAWQFMPGKPLSIEELQRISLADSVMDQVLGQEQRNGEQRIGSKEHAPARQATTGEATTGEARYDRRSNG